MVIVQSQTNLLQIVFALCPSGGFARVLDGRQKQRYQDGDDCDHDKQFDQRESNAIMTKVH